MMTSRAPRIAASALAVGLALAASPAARAAALPSPIDAPDFRCTGPGGDAGGTVSWADGVAVIGPTLAYLDAGLAEVDGTASKLDCDDGAFGEGISERKPKDKKEIEYLKVTMKEVFSTSVPDVPPQQPAGSHLRWTVSSALQDAGVEAGLWATQWDLFADFVDIDPRTGALRGRSTHFLGLRFVGSGAFEGLDQVRIGYDRALGTLSFVAPLQVAAGRLSLQDAPLSASVPEPGALALAGLGLVGVALAGRRRTG